MYISKAFETNDSEKIYSFLEGNAFGQIVSHHQGQMLSTFMPFLLSEDRTKLLGHFAAQNPHWKALSQSDGAKVLVSFLGPHGYISPSWYSAPGVPTWNYQAMTVEGVCTMFRQEERLKEVVDSLTEKYEACSDNPWQSNYDEGMLGGIVGLEVEITDIQCSFKLNQNRSLVDQQQVADQLEKKWRVPTLRSDARQF